MLPRASPQPSYTKLTKISGHFACLLFSLFFFPQLFSLFFPKAATGRPSGLGDFGWVLSLWPQSPPWVLGALHSMLSHDAAPGATKPAPLGKASSSPHDGLFFPSNKSYFCCLASRSILSPAAVRALPPPAERELCEIRDPGYWVADEASLPNPFSQTDPAVAFLALLLSGFVSWHVPIPSWEV